MKVWSLQYPVPFQNDWGWNAEIQDVAEGEQRRNPGEGDSADSLSFVSSRNAIPFRTWRELRVWGKNWGWRLVVEAPPPWQMRLSCAGQTKCLGMRKRIDLSQGRENTFKKTWRSWPGRGKMKMRWMMTTWHLCCRWALWSPSEVGDGFSKILFLPLRH